MHTSRQTIALYWRANMRYPKLFFGAALFWMAGITLSALGIPLVIAQAVDRLVEVYQAGTGGYWQIFLPYLAALAVCGIVGQLAVFAGFTLLSKLETKVRPELQNEVFGFLTHQSMGFHANMFSGSLVSQANRFASGYVGLTDNLVIAILQLFVNAVFSIAIIGYFAWPIALFAGLWTLFFIWLNIRLMRGRMRLSKLAAAADSIQTAHLADSVGNIAAVKAFGNEKTEAATYRQKTRDWGNKKYRAWIRATRNGLAVGTLMTILRVGVLALSVYAVMQGRIELGTFLLVHVYITQLIGLLWNFENITRSVEQNLSDASEMTELLQHKPTVQDPAQPEPLRVSRGRIAFEGVDFTHDRDAKNGTLFTNFNLSIKSGEKIGLVGHSGAGKSTLVNLLLRFVDVDGGTITIDGQDIAKVRQAELRRAIAYVPQEPALFHRSLRDNIAYGKPDATDKEVADAARKAHAAEFIEQLPEGYDTMVGERGVKLSGGQRQRIAIARAILKDAPILVLDEATSALDSESEKLIQDAMAKLMKGRTAIVIAHRLSTIQKLDRIVVLADGKVIEDGTHAALLARAGTYAQLWAHQSGGFIEE